MASSLLALLDDIASLLDDVSVLTKVAAKKTAGVLGDDLALNAQQVTGVTADRELPVVWAVAKGSALNKAILVPAALAISALEGWLQSRGHPIPLILPLLMLGGAFLCYEGAEKVLHVLHRRSADEAAQKAQRVAALADPAVDMVEFERNRIKGAIRTDFILSAEIIVITLGTVADATFSRQLGVLVGVSVLMTIGVYGLVAGIVKLDDLGLHLAQRASMTAQAIGRGILRGAPWLMKGLSIAGTAAMFLVGGGILVHGIPALHHLVEPLDKAGGVAGSLGGMLANGLAGLLAGLVLVGVVAAIARLRGKPAAAH